MWLQLKIHAPDKHIDVLSDALSDLGASALTYIDRADEPIYEPHHGTTPFWQQTTIVGLFAANIDAEKIMEQLHLKIRLKINENIKLIWHSEPLKDQVWEKAWMDHFEPMKFGNKLWVCPSWKAIPDPNGINILLDPGLAFGTGTHPTTALCLEALTRHALDQTNIIDYGCGSGILAIASIKLGASNAWCIDNDPQALLATSENTKKNNVENNCHLFMANKFSQHTMQQWSQQSSQQDLQQGLQLRSQQLSQPGATVNADLLIANILAKPLVALAAYFAQLLNDGADILLSGILQQQEQEIVQAYTPWFDITEISKAAKWLCIEGKRKPETTD